MIKIFNRSHYEDVLVTRVHNIIDDETAKKRMKAINDFERLLSDHNNTIILKFYLHVSKEEQAERLAERMKDPAKMWKYNAGDEKEANHRETYTKHYEEVFATCSHIPWHIIPADQNWYKAHLVARTLRDTLKNLNMKYPTLDNTTDQR
jgi:polyphosphate kinase 2 (PPK2 family)